MDTNDVNEDVLVELDEAGHVVSMNIEHAKKQTGLSEYPEHGGGPQRASMLLRVRYCIARRPGT